MDQGQDKLFCRDDDRFLKVRGVDLIEVVVYVAGQALTGYALSIQYNGDKFQNKPR